jgi:hypothetical protein
LENNQQALTEGSTDKQDNDTALTNISPQPRQNKQKRIHDPIASHVHTEDIARVEAMGIPSLSLIEKSP